MTTVHVTLGIFGGIFDEQGKLLIKQREGYESLPGEWDLPGGGVELFAAEAALDERVLIEELRRELMEELGMDIPISQRMPAMYPAMPERGRDLALATIIGIVTSRPTKGKWRYVSPGELEKIALGPKGNRLVSGYGKRMHRLCLRMLASRDCSNPKYRKQAGAMLKEIQDGL
jgi:hypothetical protein